MLGTVLGGGRAACLEWPQALAKAARAAEAAKTAATRRPPGCHLISTEVSGRRGPPRPAWGHPAGALRSQALWPCRRTASAAAAMASGSPSQRPPGWTGLRALSSS